ncbi:MAG: hypothetical protein ACJAS9_000015 [Polaribacter sp.]|jgi:hypothetical protein
MSYLAVPQFKNIIGPTQEEDIKASGEFVTIDEERFYAIKNVDCINPFFVSVISNSDHWLFVSSTGGLTAGRGSPDTALFPYVTVDKIHESSLHTGSKTLMQVENNEGIFDWEPFNSEQDNRYQLSRNIYKNALGNKLFFEEINHSLQVAFSYCWLSSEEYGFVRHCKLRNLSKSNIKVELLDGLQNILPAGTPRFTQTNSSNLVDAYKWTELDDSTGVALYTLYSAITDRAEPSESLHANSVFCLGLNDPTVLVSSEQLNNFKKRKKIKQERHKRGIRGAYFVNTSLFLSASTSQEWRLVANIEQSQTEVVDLIKQLSSADLVYQKINQSIYIGSDELSRIMSRGDGFQATAEEEVSTHHLANVTFNILRGGTFDDQYNICTKDFAANVKLFNCEVFNRHEKYLTKITSKQNISEILSSIKMLGDPQLERLASEYLPISFGRRHGDPSRPWNQFSIKLKDKDNNRLLTYQGNWRDIFQNWEALCFSYPEFIESVIAKFVNASTMDGYNPYRITKEGIDWEVEEPDDPWSYIGYWGDHQIIYLQKLLELSSQFHPLRLGELLTKPIFSYANVPYKIKEFASLQKDAKNTVEFDEILASQIEAKVSQIGSDGKLVLDNDGDVYLVTLMEKLLVGLLSKLGNLVLDGGIWLNTQRPEWNDANNALVGQGLSMVTLCYLRRHVSFLQKLINGNIDSVIISSEVSCWLVDTSCTLGEFRPLLRGKPINSKQRFECWEKLGNAASDYRTKIYAQNGFNDKTSLSATQVELLLENALVAIEHTIQTNLRDDGLYNAYNLLNLQNSQVKVDNLYPMLEGQVAVLSAGSLSAEKTVSVLESLLSSSIYRDDQKSLMLYPDRSLPSFLEKNCIPVNKVKHSALLTQMLLDKDEQIISKDVQGSFRFNPNLTNSVGLNKALDQLQTSYADLVNKERGQLTDLYEDVFNHHVFTGRSGGMFGFEGLGCIYWHMVAKLLLAVQENFFKSLSENEGSCVTQKLGLLYYQVRQGLGFNKTPEEYGAFPTDPYSHTPKHAGAQQPGMTGQVKEEVLARFGELGIRVQKGTVSFQPDLLKRREFISDQQKFRYLDVDNIWQTIDVPSSGLAFTWCQVPIIYQLNNQISESLTINCDDGEQQTFTNLSLTENYSQDIFLRNGKIRQINLMIQSKRLFNQQ